MPGCSKAAGSLGSDSYGSVRKLGTILSSLLKSYAAIALLPLSLYWRIVLKLPLMSDMSDRHDRLFATHWFWFDI